MNGFERVGQSLPRPDALDKAMGKTPYVDDIQLPNTAVAAILGSPASHAIIRNIRTGPALSHPGVLAVLTAGDIPGKNAIPMIREDWTFLAEKKAIYPGEPIAIVVAESSNAALAAREKIELELEELPAILDPEQSLEPGAPQINPLGNLLSEHKILSGNLDQGFEESDVIIEGVYETGYQEHAYLEPQGFLAVPDTEGRITVLGSMQCPFYVSNAVKAILGIPEHKIQVIQTPTGGAFGGKEDFPSLFGGLAALAAVKTGRPAKLVLDRRDDIIMSSKRHPARCYYKTGATKDGVLKACEVTLYLDPGAYATLTPAVLWRSTVHCCGPYRIPNVKVTALAGATNKVPCGAFRGFGTPKVIFAMERQMDKLAESLNMDPLLIRGKNALKKGDQTITGQDLPFSVGLSQTIEKAREMSRWEEKRNAGFPQKGSLKRGIGCATFFYGVGLGAGGRKHDRADAYLQIKPDGTVLFAVGTVDMGQGMQTVLSQIVAEGLGGISLDAVQMLPVDTTRVSDSGPTVASRGTYTSGNAILDACGKLMDIMKNVAADMLQCTPSDVLLKNGRFFEKAKEKKIPFGEVAEECHSRHIPLDTHGFFDSPPTSWDPATGQGKAYVTYSYATQIAEVDVDIETGEVKVLDIWAAHDVGKAINPQMTAAQIEGGVLQGLGYALMEFIETDDRGLIQNPSFSTYIIPTSKDVPPIHPAIVESAYPEGPYGAKGFGETPLMGVAACIANAVSDATGSDITTLPLLPERIKYLPRNTSSLK